MEFNEKVGSLLPQEPFFKIENQLLEKSSLCCVILLSTCEVTDLIFIIGQAAWAVL